MFNQHVCAHPLPPTLEGFDLIFIVSLDVMEKSPKKSREGGEYFILKANFVHGFVKLIFQCKQQQANVDNFRVDFSSSRIRCLASRMIEFEKMEIA